MHDNSDFPLVQTQKIMQAFAPTDGKVVGGVNLSTDAERMTKVMVIKTKEEIQNRIRSDIARGKEWEGKLNTARKELTEAAAKVQIPAAIYVDLEPVAVAMRKFHPGASVVKVDHSDAPRCARVDTFNYEKKVFIATAEITAPVAGQLFDVQREYVIPDNVMTLYGIVLNAQTQLANARADQSEMQQALAGLPDLCAKMEAVLIMQSIGSTESGKSALEAVDKVLSQALADLDKRRTRGSED